MSTMINAMPAPMPPKKQMSKVGFWIRLLIGLFLMLVFGRIVPPFGTITEQGMRILGTFIGAIWLVSNFGMIWPAFLVFPALVINGTMEANDITTSFFGNSIIFQMVLMMPLATAVSSCGLSDAVAKWLMTRRFVKGRPVLLCVTFMLAFVFIACIFTPSGIMFLGWEILGRIFDMCGYERKDKLPVLFFCGSFMIAWLGSNMIPMGSLVAMMIATYNAAAAGTPYVLDYGTYIISTLLLTIITAVVLGLSYKFIFRCDLSGLATYDPDKFGIDKSEIKVTKKQIIVLIGFLLSVVFSIVQTFVPSGSAFGAAMSKIGAAGWMTICFIALALIKVDGEPVFEPLKEFTKFTWGAVLCTAAFTILGTLLTSAEGGIRDELTLLLSPIFGNMSGFMLILIIVLITSIITNLMSNMATGVVVMAVVAPIALSMTGINPMVVGIAVSCTAMLGMLTMSAGAWSPLLITHEWVDSQALVLKYGSGLVLIYVIVSSIYFTVFGLII